MTRKHTRRDSRIQHSRRPYFEQMEARRMLATAVELTGGVLNISEANAGDESQLTMQLLLNGAGDADDEYQFTEAGAATFDYPSGTVGFAATAPGSFRLLASSVNAINISLLTGNDDFAIATPAVPNLAPLLADLGDEAAEDNIINLNASLTLATGDLELADATINLAGNVDIMATTGNVKMDGGIAKINLLGAAATTNRISAGGSIELGPIADNGVVGPGELEITSGTNIDLASVEMLGLLDVHLDEVTPTAGQTLTAGALTAGAITIAGNVAVATDPGDDLLVFNGPLEATTGNLTLTKALSATFNGQTSPASDHDISVLAGELLVDEVGTITLADQIDIKADGNIAITPATSTLIAVGSSVIASTTGSLTLPKLSGGAWNLTAKTTADIKGTVDLTGPFEVTADTVATFEETVDVNVASFKVTAPTITLKKSVEAATTVDLIGNVELSDLANITAFTGALAISPVTATLNLLGTSELHAGTNIKLPKVTGSTLKLFAGDDVHAQGTIVLTGSLSSQADNTKLDATVTAANDIAVVGNVSLLDTVNVTATSGTLSITPASATLSLGGASVLQAGSHVTLPIVTGVGKLTVKAGENVDLKGAIDITGDLEVQVDLATVGSTLQADAALQASSIKVLGTGSDDAFTFAGALTSNTLDLDVSLAQTATFQGRINAQQDILLHNISTVNLTMADAGVPPTIAELQAGRDIKIDVNGAQLIALAANVDLMALREINLGPATAIMSLAGATVVATTTGNVTLPKVNGAVAGDLSVSSGVSLTIAEVDIAHDLELLVDAALPNNVNATLTAGKLTARSIQVQGSVEEDDTLTFNGVLTSISGAITIGQAMLTDFNQSATAATSLTVENVVTIDLTADVDLIASAGNLQAFNNVGEINLSGAGATNELKAIGSTSNVRLTSIVDSNSPDKLQISAGHDVTLQTITLDHFAPAELKIVVDDADNQGVFTSGKLEAGIVTVVSHNTLTIGADIKATAGDVTITAQESSNIAVASNLNLLAGKQVISDLGKVTLQAGDDVTLQSLVIVQASAVLNIEGDFGQNDTAGSIITLQQPGGKISGSTTNITAHDGNADTLILPPDWLVPGKAYNVALGNGTNRVTLQYPSNFSGPDASPDVFITPLEITGGSGTDIVEVDAQLDTAQRKVQFKYLNTAGTNVELLTDNFALGGQVNKDTLVINITGNEQYLARAGQSNLDQVIVLGQTSSSNVISVADIAPGNVVAGNSRFGVKGFELVRGVGSSVADGIRMNLTDASGAQVTMIEGNGGSGTFDDPENQVRFVGETATGLGERLIGSPTVPNLILGASDVHVLVGTPGAPLPEGKIGLVPSRAIIAGGKISDLLLPDYYATLQANGQLLKLEKHLGGDYRDVLLGSFNVVEVHGPHDRTGTRGDLGGGCGTTNTIGGEPISIDVCSWLKARFPSFSAIANQINPPEGGDAAAPLARTRVNPFDLRPITASANGQPEAGSVTLPSHSPVSWVEQPDVIVAGHAAAFQLQATQAVTGQSVPGTVFQIDIDADGFVDAQVLDASGNGLTVPLTFTHVGANLLKVTAIGPDGVFGPSRTLSVQAVGAAIVAGDLLVGGTSGHDQILLMPGVSGLTVRMNGQRIGPFVLDATSQVIVQSLAGNDIIIAGRSVQNAVRFDGGAGNDFLMGGISDDVLLGSEGRDFLYGLSGSDTLDGGAGDDRLAGGAGDDLLSGGEGDDLLLGQDGRDQLYGQQGRDILLGGAGTDLIVGGAAEDILIGGSTAHDENDDALIALLVAWQQNVDAAARIQTISDPSFAATLSAFTVLDDESEDNLFGEVGEDWFFLFDLDVTHAG